MLWFWLKIARGSDKHKNWSIYELSDQEVVSTNTRYCLTLTFFQILYENAIFFTMSLSLKFKHLLKIKLITNCRS